jgi:hypothetical protein
MTIRAKRRLLAVSIVAVAALVITAVAIDWKLRADLETAREQWKAAGGVLVLADARPSSLISDEQDAAPVYRQAFELMTPLGTDEQQLLRELTDDKAVRGLLMANADAMSLVHQAASLPACAWRSRLYDDGMGAAITHLTELRTLALLLDADARIRAREGDEAGAARSIESLLQIATHSSSEPWMIALLIRLSIAHLALAALREGFQDAEVPAELASLVARPDGHRAVAIRAVQTEGAMGIKTFDDPRARAILNPWSAFRWLALSDQACYLWTMTNEVNRFQSPSPAKGARGVRAFKPHWTAPVTAVLVPALQKAEESIAHVEAQHELARAAIALRKHRAEHGAYPDTFDMPLDPFTGRPLHYQREDDGFVIWSEHTMPGSDERIEWRWN